MTVAERIKIHFNKLTRSERKLVNVLMGNYPMAGLTTIVELAEEAEVSTPTVMRTTKKLGFAGYTDFQIALREELKQTLSDPIERHDQWISDAPAEHMLNRFVKVISTNLRQSLQQLDHKVFDDIVELLADEKHAIHIVGGRITHAFADYLHTHLQVLRNQTHRLPSSAGLWPHHLLNMNEGDVLVIFDIRRYEADLLELSKIAYRRKIKIILFTDQWLSPITAQASHYTSSRIEAPSGWDSGIVIVFLIESMIAAIEQRLWQSSSSRIKDLEHIFNQTGRFKR